MNKQHNKGYFYIALLLPLVLLTGCWNKEKEESPAMAESTRTNVWTNDESQVLVTINGKKAVTVKSFERDFEMLLEDNPQLKQVLPFMPDVKRNFLTGLVNQEIVDGYVRDHKINEKPEYRADLERMNRSVERMLNTKYFAAAHPVKIEDNDVMAYYEANKDKMQELVISRGGIQTVGIQFEKESDAKAFMTKLGNKQIADVAKTENMADKVRDFKLVNKQSVGIDPVLRNKVTSWDKLPNTEMVKVADKAFWVVQATTKEETKYRAFDEVKEPLRGLVEREKGNEALQKAIEGLKADMQVVVNDDYFKPQAQQMDNMQQGLAQIDPAAQQEAAPKTQTRAV